MSKSFYIYSTLASDTAYTEWHEGGGDIKTEGRSVTIKGGTGVANKHLITPLGTVTTVSDEELAFLEANPVFKKHKDGGYIRVSAKNEDPEKVVSGDMKSRDVSAPIVPEDFPENGKGVKVAQTSKRK